MKVLQKDKKTFKIFKNQFINYHFLISHLLKKKLIILK
jgi:hypothetical protein